MNYFKNLKTSEKISLGFSLFGFFSLLIFLILINITYFFIWYADQKEMSFRSMEKNYYEAIQKKEIIEDTQSFREYLLTKDTIIIPDEGELVCSPGVTKKIHEDVEVIKDKYLYRDGETVYFIYSKYFDDIGEVKVFFDTTPYINSQLIIIKTGLIFIFIVFLLQFFIGKYMSGRLLRDLKDIANRLKKVDINTPQTRISCKNMPKDDEIRILAEALNTSHDMIDTQTKKLKQFLTDVSHEFKTPLMAMSSRLDVFEKKSEKSSLKKEDMAKLLGDTRQNISHLNGLLESLFFLSRIEDRHGCLIKKPLQVKTYLAEKIEKISESYPHKNVSYNLEIEDSLIYEVEENTFSILIYNLISNAIKFSPENAHIHILASDKHLQIQDNGPGIPQEERKKIWKKFYRKDTNKEGFGVGLYLVKRITDIYEWEVSVHQEKGNGAEFIIKF